MHPFSAEEQTVLRTHGIVLFANRVIYDAQPPMSEQRIADVQALCAGPLPPALLELWRCTAGGRLDYDLTLAMGEHQEAVSWCELFYDESGAYRDLQGWIDSELELAQEAAEEAGEPWGGKLAYLPIGGFEYCDRIYAVVEPGERHGSIIAWKRGLPPAWTYALHADGVATVAADLHTAFGALMLEQDPKQPLDRFYTGQSLREYLDERIAGHGMEQALADRLFDLYAQATVDWRTPLDQGKLASRSELARIALGHAIATDDAALIARLHAAGLSFDIPLRGTARPFDLALMQHAYQAVQALMVAGASMPARPFRHVNRSMPVEVAARLIERGALVDASDIARCVACGALDSARLVADACVGDVAADYAAASAALRAEYQEALDKVRIGKLSHYLGAEGLSERITRLTEFSL